MRPPDGTIIWWVMALPQRVVKGEYTIPAESGLSENCRNLLAAILEVDPTKRIHLEQIWEHPWMAEAGYANKDSQSVSLSAFATSSHGWPANCGIHSLLF
eukprot:scaffold571981_cov36-Prasinocladus_malaysianus.AAC.1